ncbi:MAG: hypothetical protein JWQ14_2757 [Adhaeribacter sp.]|jgi:hypothetical protein|nr:hypothetical protein [Adhaeribacter sp.]
MNSFVAQRLYFCFMFFISALLTLPATAQTSPKGGTLASISFIEGHWKATNDGRAVEGMWMAADGDNMVGMMRMMKDGKVSMYEILAYEQSAQGLVSLVKHFKPGLIGQEEKDKQDRYNFVEASAGRAIFQKEGEALRILYEKRSANQFVISRGNLQDNKWVFKDLFVFDRIK